MMVGGVFGPDELSEAFKQAITDMKAYSMSSATLTKSDYSALKEYIQQYPKQKEELNKELEAVRIKVKKLEDDTNEATQFLCKLAPVRVVNRVLNGEIDLDDFLFIMNRVVIEKDLN